MQWLAIILTALFVAAKLVGIVAWSWWLVFLPAIVYAGIWLLFFIIAFIVAMMEEV